MTLRPAPPRLGATASALAAAALLPAVSGCTIEFAPANAAGEPVVARPVSVLQSGSPPEPYADLRPDEQATVDLFEHTSPSVVYISTVARRRDFFGRVTGEVGTGTGFVWDREGHIVTNYHVVQGRSAAIRVVMHDQTSYTAQPVGGSRRHDLAVLRIDAPADSLRPVRPGDSDRVRVGQSAYAIGNPFGYSATLTTGIISALNRRINGLTGDIIEDVIQIDAAINTGNSGGPLLDSRGRLIGINSQIASPSGTSAGIGFAIPVNTVMRVVPQLITHGSYTPARLGISTDRQLNRYVTARLGVSGVVVAEVDPRSAAARTDLRGTEPNADRIGDIIVRIDGEPVQSWRDLRLVLDRYEPGDEVEVTVWRDGDLHDLVVPLT